MSEKKARIKKYKYFIENISIKKEYFFSGHQKSSPHTPTHTHMAGEGYDLRWNSLYHYENQWIKYKYFLVARRYVLMPQIKYYKWKKNKKKNKEKNKSHLKWRKGNIYCNWSGQLKLDFAILISYIWWHCHICPFSSKKIILPWLLLFLGFHLVLWTNANSQLKTQSTTIKLEQETSNGFFAKKTPTHWNIQSWQVFFHQNFTLI